MESREYWYHCGVMDAFCEIVASGVKQLALSHPFNNEEEMRSLRKEAEHLCTKYKIFYYCETSLLITDLFPYSMNKDRCNFLFYKDVSTLVAYLALKERKQRAIQAGTYAQCRKDIALAFGKLLSYDRDSCLEKIRENKEKEA